MWMKKPKPRKLQASLKVGQQAVPVQIFIEQRTNARVSIGKTGLNIRLPYYLSREQQAKQVEHFYQWAINKFAEKPELLQRRLTGKRYNDGYQFMLQGRQYTLEINEKDIKNPSAKLLNDIIFINLPPEMDEADKHKTIPQLVSRCLAKRYHQPMYNRLMELNQLYFQKEIKNFRLKYTHSVWGSCSRKGNINISTRLLFAPPDTIDYVLIHEMAHLIHPNHSAHFWNEVARCMPEYKEHEKWLKQHGAKCDF